MFAVIWRDAALDQLAEAFVQADLSARDVIEKCVNRFNSELAINPRQFGESRGGRLRVAFDAPCGIYFVADDPLDGVVRVTHFWVY
ncbi:hypothetical protein [Zavarzinella formosa]|uniref:hypothetical protein n=1 Tax=Zavarzinella formosa TaxID=360055 RepID=UPI00037E678B|nr:hypothetical protein [Zavarzinella formosa]